MNELALTYVARFATSRAKLGQYLRRKLQERGWATEREAPVASIVEKLADAGYIDDPAYALAKARTLGARGYGERRVAGDAGQGREAVIWRGHGGGWIGVGETRLVDTAERVEKRVNASIVTRGGRSHDDVITSSAYRIGPFAPSPPDRRDSDKALAAMIRAGHPFELARQVLNLPPDFESGV